METEGFLEEEHWGGFEDEQDFSRERQEFGGARVRGQCFPDFRAVNMARHC